MDEEENCHCIECGVMCDGIYRGSFDESLCLECAEELGENGENVNKESF